MFLRFFKMGNISKAAMYCFLALFLTSSSLKAASHSCHKIVLAEYCFESGSIKDLLPLDIMEKAFSESSNSLLEKRKFKSKLPLHIQAKIEQQWKEATKSAYLYARNHTLRFSSLSAQNQAPPKGGAIMNKVARLLWDGPLFRLTFEKNSKGVFLLSKPVEINRRRLLGMISQNQIADINYQLVSQMFVLMLQGMGDRDYVPVAELLNSPQLQPLFAMFRPYLGRIKASNLDVREKFLGLFGVEVMVAFYTEFDLRMLERNERLNHKVNFFGENNTGDFVGDTHSPQVTFNGELLLPDDFVTEFNEEEISLLLQHEATHLAKPNFFTIAFATDQFLQVKFPEIDIDKTSPIMSNFFERRNPGFKMSCPLNLVKDDELLTDYFTMFQYRKMPDKLDAYEALLKKLFDKYDAGKFSQMAFRVKHLKTVRDRIDILNRGGVDIARENELIQKALTNAVYRIISKHFARQTWGMEDMLDEMEKFPDIAPTAASIRILIQYYKLYNSQNSSDAAKSTGPGQLRTLGMDCKTIGKQLEISNW